MKRVLFLVLFITSIAMAQQKPVASYSKDGIKLQSYDYKGIEPLLQKENDTIYVVNFWATWCAPCIKELPFFEKLNTEYQGRKVKVLLVSLDMKKQVETSLIPFIIKRKLQSQVIHLNDPNADAWISKVDPSWSGALPATVIYTKGRRKFYEQSFTYEALEQEVKQFLN